MIYDYTDNDGVGTWASSDVEEAVGEKALLTAGGSNAVAVLGICEGVKGTVYRPSSRLEVSAFNPISVVSRPLA